MSRVSMNVRFSILALVLLAGTLAIACSGSGSAKKTATAGVTGATPGAAVTSIATANRAGGGAGSSPASLQRDQGLSVVEIADKLAPSIVRVQTEGATLDAFGRSVPRCKSPEGGIEIAQLLCRIAGLAELVDAGVVECCDAVADARVGMIAQPVRRFHDVGVGIVHNQPG